MKVTLEVRFSPLPHDEPEIRLLADLEQTTDVWDLAFAYVEANPREIILSTWEPGTWWGRECFARWRRDRDPAWTFSSAEEDGVSWYTQSAK